MDFTTQRKTDILIWIHSEIRWQSCTQEAKEGGSPLIWGQPWIQRKTLLLFHCIWFLWDRFLYVALAVLELCLMSAGVKGVCQHCPASRPDLTLRFLFFFFCHLSSHQSPDFDLWYSSENHTVNITNDLKLPMLPKNTKTISFIPVLIHLLDSY